MVCSVSRGQHPGVTDREEGRQVSNGVAPSGESIDSVADAAKVRVADDLWWSAMLDAARRVISYHAAHVDGNRDRANKPGRSADGPNVQRASA